MEVRNPFQTRRLDWSHGFKSQKQRQTFLYSCISKSFTAVQNLNWNDYLGYKNSIRIPKNNYWGVNIMEE